MKTVDYLMLVCWFLAIWSILYNIDSHLKTIISLLQ